MKKDWDLSDTSQIFKNLEKWTWLPQNVPKNECAHCKSAAVAMLQLQLQPKNVSNIAKHQENGECPLQICGCVLQLQLKNVSNIAKHKEKGECPF